MSRKQKHRKGTSTHALPKIDVVITTGGRFDMLEICLKALEKEAQTVPMAVYVIDNASPGDERNLNQHLFFSKEDSHFSVFKSKRYAEEKGFPESNNDGAKMGFAPLIMFLNDDVELHEGSVQKVIDTFKDQTVGVVGIKLIFPPTSTSPIRPAGKVQHVGMALNIRGDAEHPLVGWSPDNPKTCENRDVISTTGACLTIRRPLFNKVGGFGLEYGMGTWEDVDLCMKVRASGFRNYVNAKATGYHYVGATSEKKRRPFPLQSNKLIFQSKWANTGLMAWTSADFY